MVGRLSRAGEGRTCGTRKIDIKKKCHNVVSKPWSMCVYALHRAEDGGSQRVTVQNYVRRERLTCYPTTAHS